MRALLTALLWLLTALPLVATHPDYATQIASLIQPAKLATLGPRGANPRVQKVVYWLETARRGGTDPGKVVDDALRFAGMTNAQAASLTKAAILRNLQIADRLGCLDSDGLARMRRGNAALARRGPYAGQPVSVDHIIPRTVCPELDNVIANLELMPLPMNKRMCASALRLPTDRFLMLTATATSRHR